MRGIAADETATTLVVTNDGGQNWILKENNLPAHLEAGPLIRDQREAQTLYAVYSLLPYTEVWRSALDGSDLLSRLDPVSLGGGFAFMLLLIIGGVLLVGWLQRQRSGGASDRRSLS